jgi:hypothetical protein
MSPPPPAGNMWRGGLTIGACLQHGVDTLKYFRAAEEELEAEARAREGRL